MKGSTIVIFLFLSFIMVQTVSGQNDVPQIVDVVWLKDGSRLRGVIIKWELERGMEFRLLTGAVVVIAKKDIDRVMQDVPIDTGTEPHNYSFVKEHRVYSFKEEGWYQNTSGFINFSFSGGAGIHHAMGYRFSRMLGVGIGTGIETHDFTEVRNIMPVYAEARGFFAPKKVSPYWAVKLGYGFALKEVDQFESPGVQTKAVGGIHFSPELGVRFGGGDVSYYAGIEYKIQDATYTYESFFQSGATFTDVISYRRVEFRTGILF